ncbi:MAG TPA: cobalamin-binding protein, partial [Tepidanaerobacter syntrophicus]
MSDFKHLTEALGNLDEEEVLRILKDFVASNPSQEEA